MTHADITDIRGLSLSAPSAAAIERFDALIDDIYYYRLGTGDRLDAACVWSSVARALPRPLNLN